MSGAPGGPAASRAVAHAPSGLLLTCSVLIVGTGAAALVAGSRLLVLLGLLLAVGWAQVAREYVQVERALRQLAARYPAPCDALLVYTDSPHWKDYIEREWIPRWGHRLVSFNRSRPWRADEPEARVWIGVAGSREHTPGVILFRTRGAARIVRSWQAFRDHKHGQPAKLREAERQIALLLGTREGI